MCWRLIQSAISLHMVGHHSKLLHSVMHHTNYLWKMILLASIRKNGHDFAQHQIVLGVLMDLLLLPSGHTTNNTVRNLKLSHLSGACPLLPMRIKEWKVPDSASYLRLWHHELAICTAVVQRMASNLPLCVVHSAIAPRWKYLYSSSRINKKYWKFKKISHIPLIEIPALRWNLT